MTAASSRETDAAVHDRHEKDLLRFLTCGSVDDGKSTLIGRLLHDTGLLPDDQLRSLARDSQKHGTAGDDLDFALVVDGLEAEREQGITIDVAYRFFTTSRRKFIVADTPGHEQYTRNMATGASNSDLAVILVDARNGLLQQTRRHAFITSLLGIRHVVLAVNKIDLVGYDAGVFHDIARAFERFAASLAFQNVIAIPLSARHGDNVTTRSRTMDWYEGPTLLGHLESVSIDDERAARPFRMPVQWVNRPNQDFRGFAGTIASGHISRGDSVVVAGSGRASTVAAIIHGDGERPRATAGEAVTLTLTDEIDISRGDVLCPPDARPDVADQFAAHIVWLADDPALPGRSYLLKIGARSVGAQITDIKHRVDIATFAQVAAKRLDLNDIAAVNVALSEPVAFDAYAENRQTGAFILIDRLSNQTAGAGMIDFALRRAANIHPQALTVSKGGRAALKAQRPVALWFTGLSGAGKSTIANLVEAKLLARGRHTYILDGDNVRHGLNRDLGFTDADRVENIRRVAEVAKLFVDAGLITLVSFISPFRAERRMARELFETGEFIEIHVATPLAVAEARDPKGLYAKARAGRLPNFTGIDSPYEPPEAAELTLDTTTADAETLAEAVVTHLLAGHYI